jgi:hypothetical protein
MHHLDCAATATWRQVGAQIVLGDASSERVGSPSAIRLGEFVK